MQWTSAVRERLRSLFFRAREESEMDEELRFHLQMEAEKNERAGMSPEEARRQAVLAFGGVERFREEVRDARGMGWAEVLARDVRYALRGLRLNPLFTVTMVLTLALGIGASAAVFSVVDALLLRPLPYHDPDRLVEVGAVDGEGNEGPYVDWAEAEVWREQSGVFQDALSHDRRSVLFIGGSEPKMLTVEGVTPNFEEVLGVRPALGRGLYPEDAEPGAAPVAVLDHAFWRSAFGADPAVIGHSMELDGTRYRIVGVMPEGFKFPEYSTTELWLPIHSDGSFLGAAGHGLYFVGRIAPGSLERAQARADAVARALAEAHPREEGWSIRLRPMAEMRARDPSLRRAVYLLMGAVALLLLVAAVNATSLLLVRSWSRARELAVRMALGAPRRRVVGQLLTESVLLALLSGVAAALIALAALHAIRGIMPDSITFFAPYAIQMGRRPLAFTFVVAAATGLLTGLVPALRVLRTSSSSATAGLTPYASHTPVRSRLRRALVVAEVAVSVVLLLGAGLLLHSFVRLVRVDPGFRIDNLAVMQLNLPESSYPSSAARAAFLHRLEARLEGIPGVEGVAVNSQVPPNGGISFGLELTAEGGTPPSDQPPILPVAWVPPDFFPVLGIPIVAGRSFTEEDAGTDHAIINRELAHFLWAGESPLGRRFRIRSDSPWLTVVGVVGDLKMTGPDDRQSRFGILYPLGPNEAPSYVPLAIRTRSDPGPLLPAFRAAVHELDPRQPVEELRPARELYAATIDMPRFLMVLMSILSGLALLLSAVGVYGVLASGVAQRRRDLGIRMALGASAGRVGWGVLREGMLLASVGVIVGAVASVWLSRLVRGLLYGVEPGDPIATAAVVLVSLAAAALACWLPARRATRVDPAEVLRAE